jgi:hypothetical protein
LSIGLILVSFAIAILTHGDYGITWDESYHLDYGDHILEWYVSGFEDETALTFRIDYLYGGGFDLLGAIFRWFADPMDKYQAIHLMGSLIGVLGIWGTWKLGRLLGGARAGFLAALFLALTSVYYGHMFNNPKDLPFAVGYVWGLYHLCAAILLFPRIPWRLGVWMAISFGLAMSVRIGGLLLFCYFIMAIVGWSAYHGIYTRSVEVGYQHLRGLALRGVAIVAGAWAVMLVWWPWALLDPIRRPIAALTRMSEFIDHRRKMPFAGEWISNLDVPRDYLLHYFGYKLPELVIILFLAGFAAGLAWLALRGLRPKAFPRALAYWVLGFAIVFPPAYAVHKGSVLYDGLRHFLFIVPPIIVVGVLFLEALTRHVVARWGTVGVVTITAVVSAHAADQLATSIRYHPQQYVYFNRFIGGLAGADGNYSTDYYGATFKEATEGLAQYLWEHEPEAYLDGSYVVAGCLGRGKVAYYLPKHFSYRRGKRDPFDFWIGYTRGKCDRRYPDHPVILEVRRDGGLLTVVRDVRRRLVSSTPRSPEPAKARDTRVSSGDDEPGNVRLDQRLTAVPGDPMDSDAQGDGTEGDEE